MLSSIGPQEPPLEGSAAADVPDMGVESSEAAAARAMAVVARRAGHRVLWVPRCVAEARGPAEGSPRLTGHQILVYLDRLNRADNKTGRVTAETTGCAARTGLTPETVRSAGDQLAKAGLFAVIRPRSGRRHAIYRVMQGSPTSRISVPVAAIWPTDALDCPPRWPHSDAGRAVRALLAILRLADHATGRVVGPQGTPYTAEQIAEGAAMNVSYYRLGLTAIVGAGPPTGTLREGVEPRTCGWLTVTPQTRPHSSGQQTTAGKPIRVQQASLVVIDWAALPAQAVARPTLTLVADHPEDGAAAADTGEIVEADTREVVESGSAGIVEAGKQGNRGGVKHFPGAFPQMLSSSDAPSPHAQQRMSIEQAQGGREGVIVDDLETTNPAAWVLTAREAEVDERLRAAISEAGSHEGLSDAWWVACILANVRFAPAGHALDIEPYAAERVSAWLLQRRPGWGTLDLASALTEGSSGTANDPTGVLIARIQRLPDRPLVRTTAKDGTWRAPMRSAARGSRQPTRAVRNLSSRLRQDRISCSG